MNKISKVAAVAAISLLAGGMTFARGLNNANGRQSGRQFSNATYPYCYEMNGRQGKKGMSGNGMRMGMGNSIENVVGTVKSIDEKNNKISILNADNKEVEVSVNGFSRICNSERKEIKLSEIKSGTDIIAKICNTGTTAKVAGKVFVK